MKKLKLLQHVEYINSNVCVPPISDTNQPLGKVQRLAATARDKVKKIALPHKKRKLNFVTVFSILFSNNYWRSLYCRNSNNIEKSPFVCFTNVCALQVFRDPTNSFYNRVIKSLSEQAEARYVFDSEHCYAPLFKTLYHYSYSPNKLLNTISWKY